MDAFAQGKTRGLELAAEYDLTQKKELGALPPRTRVIPRRLSILVRRENIRRLLKLVKFDLLFEIQTLF